MLEWFKNCRSQREGILGHSTSTCSYKTKIFQFGPIEEFLPHAPAIQLCNSQEGSLKCTHAVWMSYHTTACKATIHGELYHESFGLFSCQCFSVLGSGECKFITMCVVEFRTVLCSESGIQKWSPSLFAKYRLDFTVCVYRSLLWGSVIHNIFNIKTLIMTVVNFPLD